MLKLSIVPAFAAHSLSARPIKACGGKSPYGESLSSSALASASAVLELDVRAHLRFTDLPFLVDGRFAAVVDGLIGAFVQALAIISLERFLHLGCGLHGGEMQPFERDPQILEFL